MQLQRSFDDLGTPLHEVTFVVIDLETTGGSPAQCGITEVGAVKLRGECHGTFQTLVNPGVAIPPSITYLTGITEAMVTPAPRIEAVLPSLIEFVGDAVIVGHNVRFDLGFLKAAADQTGYPRFANRFVDTCGLARRLVHDEVPDCRLSTLSTYFRTATRPTHRALDDALATGELLHFLLERAGTLGVLGLDDLLALPTVAAHPQAAKLRLVAGLPRRPGVYLFRDGAGRVLYVGRAVDLRRRVRSYFSGDERRKVGQLLREVEHIDHIVCTSELEAAVREVRLIHELSPRFNRQAKLWRRYAYLKLTLDERFPRLSVVRSPRPGDGCLYLGPFPSAGSARLVADAVESVIPIRRCTKKPTRTPRGAPCASAQLGVSTCPCAGAIDESEYAALVDRVRRGLTHDPDSLLSPLAARMRALASEERFEEAALTRQRLSALARALTRQRRFDSLRRAGQLVVHVPGEGGAILDRGRLRSAWWGEPPTDGAMALLTSPSFDDPIAADRAAGVLFEMDDGPLPREMADELHCVGAWLEARAERLRVLRCESGLSWPLPDLPRFEPVAPARNAS